MNQATQELGDRYDKVQYLRDNCSQQFVQVDLLDALVQWMSESEFDQFFDHLCRNWEILLPSEYEERMSQIDC